MKRAILLSILLLTAAGYVYLQTTSSAPRLATLMPSGALLYLEAPDFSRLLHDWDESKLKSDWPETANYSVFSNSNLFNKLEAVFKEYGEAAGFLPDLKNIIEIAGTDSALALYDFRDVEFLYVTRVAGAEIMKSQLWAVREQFEQREAGGVPFYLHTDSDSRRTVAFALTKGYLLLATRDDLMAQSLELLAGGGNPSIASDRWFRDSTAEAPNPGELRLVMNLESLVKSVYFRSYWVQRNAETIRRYWAGVADVKRSGNEITESRVFLRTPNPATTATPSTPALSTLLPLVPPEAGLYKISPATDAAAVASLIVQKLIGPQTQRSRDWRQAPSAVSPDSRAGSESDLETRIDEQPLPSDAGITDSESAARAMLEKARTGAVLLVQSSSPAAGTFVEIPSVIVLEAAGDWDLNSVRSSLGAAAGKLWTTSQLGANWISGTAGRHSVQRLDGLGTLQFVNRGRLLFLSNNSQLLAAVLDRTGTTATAERLTYAAGFRHLRERPNYQRVMTALDFTSSAANIGRGQPPFFSANLGSLSQILSNLAEIRITEQERGNATIQTVLYTFQ